MVMILDGGNPWHFAVRGLAFRGLIFMVSVFAGKEDGSIDLQVCLPYKTLEAMSNDPNFMDAVSN